MCLYEIPVHFRNQDFHGCNNDFILLFLRLPVFSGISCLQYIHHCLSGHIEAAFFHLSYLRLPVNLILLSSLFSLREKKSAKLIVFVIFI